MIKLRRAWLGGLLWAVLLGCLAEPASAQAGSPAASKRAPASYRLYIEGTGKAAGAPSLFTVDPAFFGSVSSFDQTVRLWSVASMSEVATYYAQSTGALVGACRVGDAIYVVQAGGSAASTMLELTPDKLTQTASTPVPFGARRIGCSNASKFIAVANDDQLTIFDTATRRVAATYRTNWGITSLDVHGSNAVLLSGSGVVLQLEVRNGKLLELGRQKVEFLDGYPTTVKYSPSGHLVAISSSGNGVRVLRNADLALTGQWDSFFAGSAGTSNRSNLAWRSDGEFAAAGTGGAVLHYVTASGAIEKGVAPFVRPSKGTGAVLSLGDGERLVIGGLNGSVRPLSGFRAAQEEFAPRAKVDEFVGENTEIVASKEDDLAFILIKGVRSGGRAGKEAKLVTFRDGRVAQSRFKVSFGGGPGMVNCMSWLTLDGRDADIGDLKVGDGPSYKAFFGKRKFPDWPGGPSFDYCVNASRDRVVFTAGHEGSLVLYEGTRRMWVVKAHSPVWSVAFSKTDKYVLAFCADGSVEYHSPKDGALLWTLILVQSEWMIKLPSMHFMASSPDILQKVRMAFNGGPAGDQPMTLDTSMLYDVFYRPDVVRTALRGEDIAPLTGSVTLEQVLANPPPKVRIEAVPATTSESRIRVRYVVTPEAGGIAEVRVFQNGKLVQSDGSYKDALGKTFVPVDATSEKAASFAAGRNATLIDERPGSGLGSVQEPGNALRDQMIVRGAPEKTCNPCNLDAELDVFPGVDNTLTVVAFNRDNTVQSKPESVTFLSTLPKSEPQLWVLGVGINEFKRHGNKRLGSLVNARKDAQDFLCGYVGATALQGLNLPCNEPGRARTLFKLENIHVVGALLDESASKVGILGALEQVAQRAKPGDTFVWFVASHGLMDANSLFGIVAHDTQCMNQDCTQVQGHITSNEILEASKKIKAMKQLVVLDTCHAGGLDHRLSGLYDARVSLLAKNMGLHLYASAQATEKAQDGRPGTNGAFTEQLLRGLQGAAPRNADNQISMVTLGDYAREQTINATSAGTKGKSDNSTQTPVILHFGQDAGLVKSAQ